MAQETNTTVRGALAATNDATPIYRFRRAATPYSTVGVMVYGTWVGTIQIQISDPGRNVWVGIEDWTANGFKELAPPCDCDIRLHFTRTSGTAIGAIINNA